MRNIEISPQKSSANNGNDFERVDTFLLESSGSTDNFGFDGINKQTEKIREFYRVHNTPLDKNIRIDKLLVEVDRTDVGRKLI